MTGAARRRRRRCQWNRGRFRFRFAGTRPYALRPTFATINLARGENIKTVSVLLGHADASYTLDLHVGFIPATTRGSRTATSAGSSQDSWAAGESIDLRRIPSDKAARCAILSFA